MTMPAVGDAAPPFSLKDQSGRKVKLSDFGGKSVVLYFYPKDDTPGCTKEACAFRDEHTALREAGTIVLGVSPDEESSHAAFAEKFGLPFPLLADTDHSVCESYGTWQEKTAQGKTYWGVTRATFLIGPDGRIERVWPKVQVDGHVEEVKAALASS
jgi:peroxiredoxin Q/BCP